MMCSPTDDRSPAAHGRKDAPAESPAAILDALAIHLGKLAAQRDFAKAVEDEADTDLSSPQGRVAS